MEIFNCCMITLGIGVVLFLSPLSPLYQRACEVPRIPDTVYWCPLCVGFWLALGACAVAGCPEAFVPAWLGVPLGVSVIGWAMHVWGPR